MSTVVDDGGSSERTWHDRLESIRKETRRARHQEESRAWAIALLEERSSAGRTSAFMVKMMPSGSSRIRLPLALVYKDGLAGSGTESTPRYPRNREGFGSVGYLSARVAASRKMMLKNTVVSAFVKGR